MSREPVITARPLAVWLAVSAAAALTARGVPSAWRAAGHGPGSDAVVDLLVAGCATGLSFALAWLWVVTTVTVTGLLTGRARAGGGTTRRLVLLACGVAVAAGTALPATAVGGEGRGIAGLALPDRAVAPAAHHHHRPHARPSAARTGAGGAYVVRPGDSLSSIALAHPGGSGSLDERWRAIWRANRDVVGDDPDLIIPGQELHLPASRPIQDPNPDGDR